MDIRFGHELYQINWLQNDLNVSHLFILNIYSWLTVVFKNETFHTILFCDIVPLAVCSESKKENEIHFGIIPTILNIFTGFRNLIGMVFGKMEIAPVQQFDITLWYNAMLLSLSFQ